MLPLAISGQLYTCKFLDKTTVEITRRGGKSYRVDIENNSCSCPDYTFRNAYSGNGYICKHLSFVSDIL